MKKFLLLLLFFPALLTARPLSKQAKISLLTVAPGADLYSLFGHSAIRVHDPAQNLDQVYGYGTFDFSDPNFIPKFLKRELDYFIDVDPYIRFVKTYDYFQRSFDERVLDLDSVQTQGIFDFLENNMRPENRFYRYDFFFDNCATRIRDVLFDHLEGKISLENKDEPGPYSFRDILDQYLLQSPWTDFGMDLAIGAVVDKKASPWEESFHPDYLAKLFDNTVVQGASGSYPLVSEQHPVFETPSPMGPPIKILAPIYVFSLLLLIVGFFTWKNRTASPKRFAWDGVFFSVMGLAGIILFLLWFATDHRATKENWNLLWLLPTHIIPGILLFFPAKKITWLKPYFLVSALIAIALVLGWFVIPQAFHMAFLPIMLASAIRNGTLYKKLGDPIDA